MSDGSSEPARIVPARLSFLAIYNPLLGTTDETFRDQVVFYYSRAAKERHRIRGKDVDHQKKQHEDENEKLRQIGLAQGMLEFAKSFSNGQPIDHIETEKSRIVLHELERDWWILASLDLTRLPKGSSTLTNPTGSDPRESKASIEYSAREVSSPALLAKQLQRAYAVFLLHHAPSLSDLWERLSRTKFCSTLERFWGRFAQSWDVLLHGNPAADVYGGIKLAAGGELGIGVGEEEWGSGEREVLEDYIRRTDGLVDMIVSRYGDAARDDPNAIISGKSTTGKKVPWMGTGKHPEAGDGVIFTGIGAINRQSTQHISRWMESIYAYGEDAYGVGECPTSSRRKRVGRRASKKTSNEGKDIYNSKDVNEDIPRRSKKTIASNAVNGAALEPNGHPGIPRPIVSAAEGSLKHATAAAKGQEKSTVRDSQHATSAFGDTETWMKYLTLGYGSSWGGSLKRPNTERQPSRPSLADTFADRSQLQRLISSASRGDTSTDDKALPDAVAKAKPDESIGQFLIGLRGDPENEDVGDEESDTSADAEAQGGWNSRIVLRTLHVEMGRPEKRNESLERCASETRTSREFEKSDAQLDPAKTYQRLRVLVYIRQPFLFTFLFSPQTIALTLPSFYRTIHHHLGPLQKPLLSSTSPFQVSARIASFSQSHTTFPNSPTSSERSNPIFDLVHDPSNLTVHTSIPNIPLPGTLAAEGLGYPWTRLEALNVHTQILNAYTATRRRRRDIERTAKTSRGWWVVWMRLPPNGSEPPDLGEEGQDVTYKEAVLARKASDYAASAGRISSLRIPSGTSSTSGTPGRLAEGIGVDARKHIESLLSLNR